jgi:signal transduction histidine kinase
MSTFIQGLKPTGFQKSHFLRTLLETALIGLAVSLLYFILRPTTVTGLSFAPGMMAFLGYGYAALRWRLPEGGWRTQALQDLLADLGFSLIPAALTAGLLALLQLQGNWAHIWGTLALSCAAGSLEFFILRAAKRLYAAWQALCRRRMAWAMVDTQVRLISGAALLITLALIFTGSFGLLAQATQQSGPQPSDLRFQLLFTVFPSAVLASLVTVAIVAVGLLALLPIFGVSSYWMARRTTRRLETLARAAEALGDQDLTARAPVQGEDEVARLQQRFNRMADDLSNTLLDLQAERDKVACLLDERRELFANVSHELRTPAAIIRSSAEALQSNPNFPAADPTLQNDLQTIQDQVTRLQQRLDDLFLLSSAEVRRLSMTCQPVDLNELAGRVTRQFAGLAWQTGKVEVTYTGRADLPPAWADPARLEQALVNLLRNAVRFTPPGGLVLVEADAAAADAEAADAETAGAAAAGGLRLSVRDTGSGIAPADLPHIWERFYHTDTQLGRSEAGQRLSSGEPARPGELNAGLGLPMVKAFMEAMGGQVSVESQPGEGSCFTLTLRRASEKA